jgi:hypothetical protein
MHVMSDSCVIGSFVRYSISACDTMHPALSRLQDQVTFEKMRTGGDLCQKAPAERLRAVRQKQFIVNPGMVHWIFEL